MGTHTTPVGDELMVHVVGTAETHLLSPTTASVWQRCDGRASRAELESVFADQPAELRPELVQLALDQLEKAGLVEDGGDSSDLQRESRRRFLRKAMVGAAIVPTVMTVTMQPAAAAHSAGHTGCTTNAECSGSTPVCDTATSSCVACLSDTHCSGSTPACKTDTRTCVPCTTNSHCSGSTPACNTATNTCVACTSDSNCSGATPACNLDAQVCAQCYGDSAAGDTYCGTGKYCTGTTCANKGGEGAACVKTRNGRDCLSNNCRGNNTCGK